MSKQINFIKMTAQGNNYIYLDNRDFRFENYNLAKLSKAISDVKFGFGSDGIVVLDSDEDTHCFMRIFNSDGSEAKMCGNALRCVAFMMAEEDNHAPILINTRSGIKTASVNRETRVVKVNMGVPKTLKRIEIGKMSGNVVDVGNRHWIIRNSEITRDEFIKEAERVQKSAEFPKGINVELINILDRNKITAIVYERGSGVTSACGSGATAIFWDCYEQGLIDKKVKIKLEGGDITVSLVKDNVILEGQVTHIGTGTFIWSENG
ncbi:MAG: diaminopimelate epimerase [Candidatus Cloacimonadales bacterium]